MFADVALKDTAQLVGSVVNLLPEGHLEYNLAIEMVDYIHNFI